MIITCPNCSKQFKIDNSLIPDEGRDLQCGACNHIWFYDVEEKNNQLLELKQEIVSEDIATKEKDKDKEEKICLLYTSPSPRDATLSRMPSSA